MKSSIKFSKTNKERMHRKTGEKNYLNFEYWLEVLNKKEYNDISKAMEYNTDGLIYDHNQIIIPCGFINSMEHEKVIKVNSEFNHPNNNRSLERELKFKTVLNILKSKL